MGGGGKKGDKVVFYQTGEKKGKRVKKDAVFQAG